MNWQTSKNSVLVPFDFSGPCREAVRVALTFVDDPSKVHVLHVVPPFGSAAAVPVPVDLDAIREGSEKALVGAMAVERADGVHTVVEFGQPADTIVNYAEQHGVELIVLPTHGRTGMDRFFVGSVAERVVRRAPSPVLVLRAQVDG
jgi:nucleotide-binding universal stress UspA family protein